MQTVSAIVPAYNAASFVAEAIDSALAQTHTDLEVIVVDDQSTDDTPEILRSYGGRITVHRQANRGVSAARNTGAQLAHGDWIAFLDADDVWAADKIQKQLAIAEAPPADPKGRPAPLIYSDRFNFGVLGELPWLQSEATPMFDGDVFAALMLRGNFITTSSVVMRRELFLSLGGFCERPRVCEDWDLWLRVAAAHPIALLREPAVGYRVGATGLSGDYREMAEARQLVIARALDSPRGANLPWHVRRQIWAETFRTNGWDAGRRGAVMPALRDYARAAAAWPLELQTFKDAVRTCLHA
jgi:glycosyltransferase involved in cell wall biosynthesis